MSPMPSAAEISARCLRGAVWTAFNHGDQMAQRAQLLAHGLALCGAAGLNREITPELRKALALKPRPEDFV